MVTATLTRPAPTPAAMGRPPAALLPLALLGMLAAHLLVRGWVAAGSYYYWDDFILVGRAGSLPLLSGEFLLYNHDGHFMPAAFLLAGAVNALAPLNWAGPAAALLVLQLVASLAVLRVLVLLLGWRWAVAVPWLFYLFSPLALPAFAWWAAGLNALPLQAGIAWVVGDAVLLSRTGRRRHAASGVAVFLVTLLFFEKALLVPVVAFAVTVLVARAEGVAAPARLVLRRGWALWAGSALVAAGWAAVYLGAAARPRPDGGYANLPDMLATTAVEGVLPALFGGPWSWERWLPAPPWATPPAWAVAACALALAALAVLVARRVRGAVLVLGAAAGYLVLSQLPILLTRSGPNTAVELVLTLRYLADFAVVGALALALLIRAGGGSPRRLTALLLAVYLAGSLATTAAFAASWTHEESREYVRNTTAALAAQDGYTLFDQEVPFTLLGPVAYPGNMASRVLSSAAKPGAFGTSTPDLRVFGAGGRVVPGEVWWHRSIGRGPDGACGYAVGAEPVVVPLGGPLIDNTWTVQLNYLAGGPGTVEVALDWGETVAAPVAEGLGTVYAQVRGGGQFLTLRALEPGLLVCVGTGPVGLIAPK